MDTEPITLALPLTVYAVNMRYNVRDDCELLVPENAKLVYVLEQFARAGEHPLDAEQVLNAARGKVESDEFRDEPLKGKQFVQVYEFGGDWSFTTQVIGIAPCPVCGARDADVKVQ